LTWYFNQTWPSKLGIQRPFYFPLQPSYWFGSSIRLPGNSKENNNEEEMFSCEMAETEGNNREKANEKVLGQPTIVIEHLKKTFGNFVAVNNMCFKMYENQIFALLGHNGAGKVSWILFCFWFSLSLSLSHTTCPPLRLI
jgi:ATP-binding cassette subfamily A (ABC1) protein 2